MTKIGWFFKKKFGSRDKIKMKIGESFLSLIIKCVESFKGKKLHEKGYLYLHILVYEFVKNDQDYQKFNRFVSGSGYYVNYDEVLRNFLIEKYSSTGWFPENFLEIFYQVSNYFSLELSKERETWSEKGRIVVPVNIYSKLYDLDKKSLKAEKMKKLMKSNFSIVYPELLLNIKNETMLYCKEVFKIIS